MGNDLMASGSIRCEGRYSNCTFVSCSSVFLLSLIFLFSIFLCLVGSLKLSFAFDWLFRWLLVHRSGYFIPVGCLVASAFSIL